MIKLLTLLTVFVLQPKHIVVPTVRFQDGGHFRIENPMRGPVEVSINCGETWDYVTVRIAPKTTLDFVIEGKSANTTFGCFMANWWRASK